jgi:hypothetical protein
MDDLLKEAIADAKAVRETALANAKMALEEAFTPRLQNMLSQKIQNEIEDEDDEKKDEAMDDEDDIEEREDDEDMEERAMNDEDEDPSDEHSDEMDESEIIEIDGVKYAPVVSEEEDDEEDMDEMKDEDDEDMDEDLDLEAVIKELESELDEAEENDDKEEVEEQSKSSGIGAGDNKVANASSGDEEDPGKGKLKEMKDKDDEEMDEDIDLDEVLAALSEEEDEDEKKDEVSELKSDLAEHRSVIETLREKLNEVNLLNAKLLFTNKLFRKHGLNNEQKMKVVEQFDRASNLREVKLVYSTLGESFGSRKNEINESKGSASKPIASTKPEKEVITESSDLRDRFKKLANLI